MEAAKSRLLLGFGVLAVLAAALASLALGPAGIPPRRVFALLLSWLTGRASHGTAALIVLQLRLPRIILGGLVGAGLAAAGTAFQAILRNPLADPYVIGVSAGAGFGAALGITLGLGATPVGLGSIPLLAFLGAVLTVALEIGRASCGERV